MKRINYMGIAVALFVPALAIGALEVPFSFERGQPVRASEMNANFAALAQRIEQLESELERLGQIEAELETLQAKLLPAEWRIITDYQNGWTPWMTSTVRCRRTKLGRIELSGALDQSEATGQVAFELPTDCRPNTEVNMLASRFDGPVSPISAFPTGNLTVWDRGTKFWLSLDGLSYPSD